MEVKSIVPVDIEKVMRKSYLEYSMSVIVARALPDVRDGLKPVNRRILYGMSGLGLTPDKPYRKSARLVGDVLGKYHPHGESSVYDATVRMAQDFNMRYPLADGHGNFGSIDGDGAAAMRYTEVRMSKLALEMLRDIGKNTVDFQLNFDESEEEPVVLPSRFPNLLVNGSAGIAVGMATNMAPHNLREVIDACVLMLDKEDVTTAELMKCIKGPDFPTGAMIMGKEGIEKAYRTGRGKLTLRAVADIEEEKNGRFRIIVTEIPYQVNKSTLVRRIADCVKNKVIEGISGLRDESNRDGIRIVIELKRDANPQVVLNLLYKYTQMQTTFGIINLALVDGEPKLLPLHDLLRHYLDHQIEIIRRRTIFDLERAEKRAHIVEGLLICQKNIDEVIRIIRESKDDKIAKDALMKRFELTDVQATAVLDMMLRRLTGLEHEKLTAEYESLIKEIARYREILENRAVLLSIIKEELMEIREKFGDARRTKIKPAIGEVDITELIKEEDVLVSITRAGYIKRIPMNVYRKQNRGGKGIIGLTMRQEDFVDMLFVASTHDQILFFTNKGRVYMQYAYEIPEGSRIARGTAIINLLHLSNDETVTAAFPLGDIPEDAALTFATAKGYVKRTALEEYRNIRKTGLAAISLVEDDELINVRVTAEDDKAVLVTRKGQAIAFKLSDARLMGRATRGVRGIALAKDDVVVSFEILEKDKDVLIVSEYGYGKRTAADEYKIQNRGGKGVFTYKITKKTGNVVSAKVVTAEDELLLISKKGEVIRLAVKQVSELGRRTSGVKLKDIDREEDLIVAVAKYVEGVKEDE